jgi:cytochrome c oxidase cbb3-type subunit III
MSDKCEIDDISGVDTTGHEWDGIKELNNPLPRWWLWTLYATVVWAVGYVIVYPALPGLSSATKGLWGWSSRGDLRVEMVAVDQGRQEMVNKISTMDIHAILADVKLRTFAVSAGASVFKVNCVQCHGSGAQGGIGYPNLNDDSWLWGGKPEQIQQTLFHGIRSADDPDTRNNQMPAFGKDGILKPEQITQVANYVFQLGGLEHDATLAAAGTTIFAENCVACHGEKGEGNQELGGPQLNDAIWLYGNTPEVIRAQIHNPRQGMMPAWQNRLGETKIKQLTAYVLSLGGGQK